MEDLICDVCHKKTQELHGFNYSETKMCNKCYILHLESQCENLRSYILNSFSENDREKFLKECCKGKLFDDVLKTFKPAISNAELEQELNSKNMFCENYNCGLNQKIQNLRQQLSKMGEEINIKNKKLAELKKELTICKDTLKRKTQSNRDLQHRVHKVNTEFAIKKLQHIEDLLFSKAMQITGTSVDSVRLYTINEIISGEIEKLKGE